MYRVFFTVLLAVVLGFSASKPTPAALARIKDIVSIEGVRDNTLIGYGLVVGLQRTGDTLTRSVFTRESLIGMLQRMGVDSRDNILRTQNVAAVMVTGMLPPFGRQGSRFDVAVSAIGDAQSLKGGTLLATPLMGADGEVYALAQGTLTIEGVSAQGNAAQIQTKGVPTAGRIANGAVIERETSFDFTKLETIKLALKNPDVTTAQRIMKVINQFMEDDNIAFAKDPGTVELYIPPLYKNDPVQFLHVVEQLPVQPDNAAKILIDDQSGLVVMGENVRISEVAIAQGNLTIQITENFDVSQPGALAGGQTAITNTTNIEVDRAPEKKLALLKAGLSLKELVNGLNALGVGPTDLISILQGIKAAGALQADIEVL